MRLYVGNLPDSYYLSELISLFESYGYITRVSAIRNFAFLTLIDNQAARTAMIALNGTEFHENKLVVVRALPPRNQLRNGSSRGNWQDQQQPPLNDSYTEVPCEQGHENINNTVFTREEHAVPCSGPIVQEPYEPYATAEDGYHGDPMQSHKDQVNAGRGTRRARRGGLRNRDGNHAANQGETGQVNSNALTGSKSEIVLASSSAEIDTYSMENDVPCNKSSGHRGGARRGRRGGRNRGRGRPQHVHNAGSVQQNNNVIGQVVG